MSFDRAFTASCACAPSRATFLTSQYPAKHRTTDTGQLEPEKPLDTSLDNLAKVLEKAGYKTRAWLGKWHLGEIDTSPIEAGFTEWNAPDAGITIGDYNNLGGGSVDNDGRYLADMLKFIEKQDENAEDPFCLVASFVSPHDGFVAFRGLGGSGYASSTLTEAILNNPTLPGQEFLHFTYDDNPGVRSKEPLILFPSIVRTIRTAEWKYSVYLNKDGTDADWELYDLTNDKYEDNNLAGNPDLNIVQKQAELEEKLQDAMNKLGTMPKTFNWPPQATPESRGVNRT